VPKGDGGFSILGTKLFQLLLLEDMTSNKGKSSRSIAMR
jgi:hypothetical protein